MATKLRTEMIQDTSNIDRKFLILAVNPAKRPFVGFLLRCIQAVFLVIFGERSGVYTNRQAVLFLAKDRLFLEALRQYFRSCKVVLGRDNPQTEGIWLLMGRVIRYQTVHGARYPDVDPGREEKNIIYPGEACPAPAEGTCDGER
jgi:hypothetical protein